MDKRTLSDSEVIDGLLDNDSAVVRYYYEKIMGAIVAHICRNSGHQDDYTLVFYVTMQRVVKNLHLGKYDNQGNFDGYFFSTARYYWYEVLRKRKKDPSFSEWGSRVDLVESYDEQPELVITNNDYYLEKMRSAFQQLDETDKVIVDGRMQEPPQPYEEIAEELGLADGMDTPRLKKEAAKLRVAYRRIIKRLQKLVDA